MTGFMPILKTKYLSDEEVQYITWQMNARYYDLDWFFTIR